MTDDVAWLIDEVNELLPAGRVGLYEFVWILHGRYPEAPAAGLLDICRPALGHFLADPAVRLGWHRWAHPGVVKDASRADLDDHAFDDIGADGRYLAIERS